MSLRSEDLFEKMMRLANGEPSRVIKIAGVNLLVAAICQRSSNVDEAILQWNELSTNAERLMHSRFKLILSQSDQFDPTKVRFNGA